MHTSAPRIVRMFKPRFAPMVRNHTKLQTIRPIPKRMPAPGWILDARMWESTPYYSPQIRLIEAVIHAVLPVTITRRGVMLPDLFLERDGPTFAAFASADGFADTDDFYAWFEHEHRLDRAPLPGVLIKWLP